MASKALKNAINSHKEKLAQPHFLMSAESPRFPEKNKLQMNHETVLSHLKGAGYDAHSVNGHYSSPERSILIYGVSPDHAQKLHGLAANLGQDSSIYSTGSKHEMLFHHGENAGKKVLGEGTTFHQHKPDDFYTTLPGGTHHFTHSFAMPKEKEAA